MSLFCPFSGAAQAGMSVSAQGGAKQKRVPFSRPGLAGTMAMTTGGRMLPACGGLLDARLADRPPRGGRTYAQLRQGPAFRRLRCPAQQPCPVRYTDDPDPEIPKKKTKGWGNMSKTRMGKRVASLLLSLVMMLSLLPTTVYAEGADTGDTTDEIVGQATTSGDNTEGTGEPEPTGEGEDGSANVTEGEDGAATNDAVVEETIAPVNAEGVDAVANAESSGDKVSGEDGNEATSFVTVNGVGYATLEAAIGAATPDANGVITYEISGKVDVTATGWVQVATAGLTDLTAVKFVGKTADAAIYVTKEDAVLADQVYGNVDVGFSGLTLVKENPTYLNDYAEFTQYFAMEIRATVKTGVVTYTDCKFPEGVINNTYGKTVFTGCEFSNDDSRYNLWVKEGEVELNNGAFTGTRGVKLYNTGNAKATITVKDTTFDGLTGKAAIVVSQPAPADVTLENVTARNCTVGLIQKDTATDATIIKANGESISGTFNITNAGNAKNEFNISAGTFTSEVPNDYCADGFEVKASTDASGNTTYGVEKAATAVAKIGDKEYATLQAAIDAANAGDTVTLLKDVETSATITVAAGKNITIDLNGKTVTSSEATPAISVSAGAKLTIKDFAGNGAVTTSKWNANCIENYGTLTIESGSFSAYYSAIKACGGSTTTITGGTFSDTGKRVGGGYGLCFYPNGTALIVTIKGGVFKSNVEKSGITSYVTLSVTGGSFANDLSAYCPDGFGTTLDAETNMYVYGEVSAPAGYKEDANGNVTISDEAGLFWFAKQVNEKGNTFAGKTVTLANDITLTNEWTPVGVSVEMSFKGTFDGGGHTISGMNVNDSLVGYGSGFINTVISATIKNVTFDNADIETANKNIVGIVAGYSYGSSSFENVHVTNSTVYAFGKVGGMVGMAADAGATTTFRNCSVSNTTIHGTYNMAGFCGLIIGTCSITGSYLKGNTVTFDDGSGYGFGKVTELDTTVTCDGSVGTCAGSGTVIKGRYIPNGDYYYSAYSDLYNHYGAGNHDCALANGKYLANSEVTHDAPVKIGDVLYSDLQAAIDAAKDGDIVTLLADIEQNSCLVIDKNITLDLNGKKIYNTVDIWKDEPNHTVVSLISIDSGAKVTITGNGTIKAKDNDCYTFNVVSGGLTIENGTFVGNISAVQVQTGTLEIKDGKFSLAQKWEGKSTYLINCIDTAFANGTAKVAISGGTFEDFDPNVSPEKKVNGKAPSFAAPGVGITKNDDGTFTATPNMVAQIIAADGSSVKAYNVLADAIAAAEAGQTVTLLADATEDVTINKNITLDLGGKTLTNANAGKATISVTGGTVTVKNGTVIGGTSYYNIEVTEGSNANLTLEGVTATAGNTGSSMIDNWGTLTINSGTYTGGLDTVKNEPGAKLTINDGTFTLEKGTSGFTGVVFNYGDLTISGGTFIQSEKTSKYGYAQVIYTDKDKNSSAVPSTVITGGTFKNLHSKSAAWTVRESNAADGATKVSGGTFNKKVSESYCADGFIPTKNADGTYDVKEGKYVAKSDTTKEKYDTLQAAITDTYRGKTVTLLTDVTENVEISKGKRVTLDLNGFTLNGGTGTAKAALTNHGTITITDTSEAKTGTIKRDDNGIVGETSYYVIDNQGTMTIEGGNVINNSGYEQANPSGSMVGSSLIRNGENDGGATLNITGGKLEQKNFIAIKNSALGTLHVTGGTITSKHSAIQNWFNADITGGEINGQLWTDAWKEGESVGKTTIGGDAKFTGEIVMDITGSVAPELAITGGDLDVTSWRITPAAAKAGAKPAVSGGTFTSAVPENYCAEGFIPTKNADGSYGVKEGSYVAETNDVKYESLQAAIDAAGRNAIVTLLADTKENVTIAKALTLDLNGHILNGGTEKGKPALTITARTVTIMDSSEAKTGTIMREDTAENSGVSSHYVIDIQGNAWVMFESGNVKNGSGVVGVKGASLVRVGDDSVEENPGLVINGGTFTQDNFIVIKVDRGYLKLNGGTLNSLNTYAVENWSSAIIKGGTVNGAVAAWTYSDGTNSFLTIEGGTVNGDVTSVNYGNAEGKTATVTITGGTFTGKLDTRSYDPNTGELTSIVDAAKATIKVSGGTFNNAVEARYCDEGYTPVQISDGKYGVQQQQQVLAKIGDTAYYTMYEAFQAVKKGETITLLRDYTTGAEQYSGSKSFAIDLNGKTWTYTGTNTNHAAFEINYSDVTLTVKNGTVVSNSMVGLIPSAIGMDGPIAYDNAGLVFEGVTMTTTATSGIETNGNNTNDTVTLKNSTLNVPNGFGIYFPSSGTLTINNSTINAKTMGVQVCAGSLDISGEKTAITATAIIEGDKTEGDGAIEDGAAISIRKREGYKDLGTITISGGTFTSNSHYTVINAFNMCNNKWLGGDATPVFNITGGTYSGLAPTNMGYLCADDFRYIQNAEYYTVEQGQYEVKVTSRIWGTDQTVATPTGGGLFDFNDMAPVETYEVSGFNFKGWYWADENGNIGDEVYAGKSLRYVVNVLYDCTLIAVYEPITGGTFNLYVKASQFKVNGKLKYDCYDMSLKAAEKVKLEYTGTDPFLYWINSSNNVVSTEQTIELVMVGNYQLTAVVEKQNTVSDYAQVIFKNAFDGGQRLCVDWYSSDDTIRFPSTPVYVGRTFKYWGVQVNGEIVEATQTAISELIKNGAKTVTIAPVYESNGTYSVEVSYVDDMGTELSKAEKYEGIGTGLMKYVEAVDIPEYTFSCWKIGDEVVGTNKTYAALSRTDRDVVKLTAVYVKDGTTVTPMNVLTFAATGATIEGGKYAITFTANYSIGEAAAIAQGGILYWNTELSEDEFTVANGQLRKINWDKLTENFGARNGTVKNTTASVTIYARAYIVLENGTTIYSDIVHASYNDIAGK